MKKFVTLSLAFAMALFVMSCGSSVEVSTEMSDFISGFNGDAAEVSKALEKYGANEEVKDANMAMYNLDAPKVTAVDGSCYTLVCKSGLVENTYTVCWEDGKITSIEDVYE